MKYRFALETINNDVSYMVIFVFSGISIIIVNTIPYAIVGALLCIFCILSNLTITVEE